MRGDGGGRPIEDIILDADSDHIARAYANAAQKDRTLQHRGEKARHVAELLKEHPDAHTYYKRFKAQKSALRRGNRTSALEVVLDPVQDRIARDYFNAREKDRRRGDSYYRDQLTPESHAVYKRFLGVREAHRKQRRRAEAQSTPEIVMPERPRLRSGWQGNGTRPHV